MLKDVFKLCDGKKINIVHHLWHLGVFCKGCEEDVKFVCGI
jgi:hypothetical protein